jgi:sarcosine oxidase subunit gamma
MSAHDVAWLTTSIAARRSGVKGPQAAAALAAAGLPVPPHPNSWLPLRAAADTASAPVVLRLGNSEYFVAEPDDAPAITALDAILARGMAGAYPVLREDRAFVLGGTAARDVLAEVCHGDFAALDGAARPVIMTLMIGVGVLVMPQPSNAAQTIYRIWCDPSYGTYLATELAIVVDRISSGSLQ